MTHAAHVTEVFSDLFSRVIAVDASEDSTDKGFGRRWGRKHLLWILVLFGFHLVSLFVRCCPDKRCKQLGARGIPEFQPTVQQRSPQSKSLFDPVLHAVMLPSLLK